MISCRIVHTTGLKPADLQHEGLPEAQTGTHHGAAVQSTCLGCKGPAPPAAEGAWGGGSTCRLGWVLPSRPPKAHEHHLWTLLGT